jgi:PAS domain S-box-containing protein
LDALPAHLAVMDFDGRIVAVNELWRQFGRENGGAGNLGLAEGANYLEACRRAEQAGEPLAGRTLRGLADLIAGRSERFVLEYPCNSTARPRWFELQALRRPELGGLLLVHTDITERKEGEQALEWERAKLAATIDSMVQGVLVTDGEGRILRMNPAAHDFAGLTDCKESHMPLARYAAEFEARHADGRIIPPSDWPLARALRGETVRDFVMYARHRPTGREWFGAYNATPLRNAEGAIHLVIVTIDDLTARRRMEQGLRQAEAWLRIATETAELGAFDYHPQEDKLVLSELARQHLGWPVKPAAAEPAPVSGRHGTRGRVEELMRQALEPGSGGEVATEYEALNATDGSEHWVLARGKVLFNEARQPVRFVGTTLDVTERRQAHAELERLVAERTARLRETVGELEHFSYTITHDLRAPLRAMEAFGQILREEYASQLDDKGKDFLRRIVDSARRMDRLITDALSYSKVVRTEMELEAVDPNGLLRGMVETYPEFQPPRVRIQLVGSIPSVRGNPAALTQVFSNLLGNAVKFVERGKQPEVRIGGERQGAHVRIWFEDNGIGIEPNQQERIFIMFQRLSSEYEGTGIGLALVRKMVERMRGKVGVESQPGKGSRFWVLLPAADETD